MGGAVFVSALQLQHHVRRGLTLEPFVGNRWAGDIVAYSLLASILVPPLRDHATSLPNLLAYCERMKERYFKE
jgi:hypothetical protein